MADTKCANPEYQLDVDIISLEYAIYKATEATIEALKLQTGVFSDGADDVPALPNNATALFAECIRLQQICDALFKVFCHNHPTTRLNPACEYQLKILELLVLLQYWMPRSSRTRVGSATHWQWPYVGSSERPYFQWPRALPARLISELNRERVLETVFRRNWLGLRHLDVHQHPDDDATPKARSGKFVAHLIGLEPPPQRSEESLSNESESEVSTGSNQPDENCLRPPNKELPCLEVGIAKGLSSNKRLHLAPRIYGGADEGGLFVLNLFDLMPRFMELSTRIAQAMGNINENWIAIACRFMQQSALERMQNFPEDNYTKPSKVPIKCIHEDFGNKTWVEECFAWGVVDAKPSTTSCDRIRREAGYLGSNEMHSDAFLSERLHTEDLTCAMLNTAIDMQAENEDIFQELGSSPGAEHPRWTETREAMLQELVNLSLIRNHGADFTSFRRPLQELCEKHPIKAFLMDLMKCIEGFWHCSTRPDVCGKPVLVQIEEGGLDGMDREEFKSFLSRVGLRLSEEEAGNGASRTVVKWAK